MKFNTGLWIGNADGTVKKDIVVNAPILSLKDLSIGGTLITAGALYLLMRAFKNGSRAFSESEYNLMEELGLFTK